MGQPSTTTADLAQFTLEGSFTGLDAHSDTAQLVGPFNIFLTGTFVATVQLEASYDGGDTWVPAMADTLGTPVALTAAGYYQWGQIEYGLLFRLTISDYTSGTVNYRFSY